MSLEAVFAEKLFYFTFYKTADSDSGLQIPH